MTFNTMDEAEEYFYEHFGAESDDTDKEEARFMNWIESNVIRIVDED